MEKDLTTAPVPDQSQEVNNASGGDPNENVGNNTAKRTFKGQSLSSLFQRTASVSSQNTQPAGTLSGSADKVSLSK